MKKTVILTGMIVILSLASPAVFAGGAGGGDSDDDAQPTPESLYRDAHDQLSGSTRNMPHGNGDGSGTPPDELPSPATPGLPPLPGGGNDPRDGDAPSPIPCSVAYVTLCDDPEEPAPPEGPPAPEQPSAPEAPSSPEPPATPRAEELQREVDETGEAVQGKVQETRGQADNLLAVLLGPVHAVAKSATDEAITVLSGVATTADFVADEASEQAHGHATQLVGIAAGLVGSVEQVVASLLFGEEAAGTPSLDATSTTASREAAVIESPVSMVTIGIIAVGSLGLIAAAFIVGRKLLGLGGIALLSRIPSKDIMKNDTRATIFDIVSSDPGVSLNEIVDRLGLSRNAVAYHLAVFESEKQVVSIKDGKYRRYFVNGGKYVNGAKDVVSTIKNDVTRNVIRFILEHPGAMQKEVCTAVGTSPSATNWHINRLEKVGLVEKEKVANTVRYSPGPSFQKYDLNEFGLPVAIQA